MLELVQTVVVSDTRKEWAQTHSSHPIQVSEKQSLICRRVQYRSGQSGKGRGKVKKTDQVPEKHRKANARNRLLEHL